MSPTVKTRSSARFKRLAPRCLQRLGPEDGKRVLCVHYLTGNGKYFDWLARDLASQGFRVIAPDMPGRGRSDNLKNPQDYVFRQYISDLGALMSALGINKPKSVDWIGASMGGLLGIVSPRCRIHRSSA